jgi:hypothetical protein
MIGRSFDPNAGDAMLVASSSDERTWALELRDFEAEKAEKAIDRLMRERTSVCG